MIDLANEKPNVALPLVLQLLGKHGHHKFDSITKTKTVENILAALTESDILKFIQHVEQIFYNPQSLNKYYYSNYRSEDADESKNEHVRLWALDQLYLLIKSSKIKKEKKWVNCSMLLNNL